MTTNTAYAPTAATPRQALASLLDRLARVPLSFHKLLFRLAVAIVFLKAGLTKVMSWDLTVQLFRDEYKVPVLPPELAATMAATFEIGCSSLLILGLATRLAAVPLLGMIMTIQLFVYPGAYAEHLTWASILLFLVTRGGGSLSLDHLIGLEPKTPEAR